MKEFMKAFDKWAEANDPLAQIILLSDGSGRIMSFHGERICSFPNIKKLQDFLKK